jgi:hypothetical protein
MNEAETENNVEVPVVPVLNAENNQESPRENETPVENKQNRHFKELRRQKDELERKLKMQDEVLERLLKAQQAIPQVQEVDEFDQIDDNEALQKGQTKRMIRKEAEKIAKEIVQHEVGQVKQQFENANFKNRLKAQFSDFDEIVNHDTLALLEEQEPELAVTISEMRDPYKMLFQSYKFIKKLGIDKEIPNSRHSKEVEKKLEKASKSVQSPQVYDKRPMAQAFRMTENMRKELADEMNYFARRASSVPEME